jgi:predicted dehydrogenase
MTPDQAREMAATADRAGRVLAVVHNFQFARSVTKARARLARGVAGELRAVTGIQLSSHDRRLPTWYQTLPCGLFYDEAPHLFYLLRSFLPDAALTHAHISPSLDDADRTPRLVSTLHDRGPAVGTLQMFFSASMSEWQLALLASRETLVCDIFRDILLRLPADGSHGSGAILRTSALSVAGHLAGTVTSGLSHLRGTLDYGNDEVVRRWVEAIQRGDAPTGISAADGLAIVEMMASVMKRG